MSEPPSESIHDQAERIRNFVDDIVRKDLVLLADLRHLEDEVKRLAEKLSKLSKPKTET